jgi:hypothetical protein
MNMPSMSTYQKPPRPMPALSTSPHTTPHNCCCPQQPPLFTPLYRVQRGHLELPNGDHRGSWRVRPQCCVVATEQLENLTAALEWH